MLEFFSITVSNREGKKKPCVYEIDNRKQNKMNEEVFFICIELSVFGMTSTEREEKRTE
jgi:hypothetical protein